MTLKKSLRIVALSTVGFLAIGGAAIAKGPPGHRGAHGGPMGGLMHAMKALDLDEEQQALAQELREEGRADHEAMRAQKEAAFEVVLTELAKEVPDSAALHELVDQGAASAAEAMHSNVDRFLELHATFTPDQRETLVTELENGKEQMEARRSEMRERGQEMRESEGL